MTDALARLAAALADRYTVDRELGRGGMATVYLAEDLKHDRKVAIKVLRPELGATLGPERFLQEIRVAARLQHPHIVGLLDSGVIAGEHGTEAVPYYVMPYMEGETLRERLARTRRLSLDETIRFTAEIADALAKAHKAGVVHRDIKPENILLSDGHALVMDFGVAKAVSDATGGQGLTSAGMSLGTPAYMAPEQVAADPLIDHRADLYSLGLVAYEMLAGGSPYSATTPQQQMAAHVTQSPAPIRSKRPDCPDDLSGLIMKCLAKTPDDRWQTAEEIVTRLRVIEPTGQRGTAHSKARMTALAGVVVLITLVVLVARRFKGPVGGGAAGDSTVGVMLFDNLTHDTAYAYLADGLASEISTTLARVPRLEVRSPGAVRSAQRGIDPDPREVGRRLNVRNVVEGEFQRGGDKIRIAVRLVAVPSGTQRWSDSWTRPVTDLLAVQEEIARAVATAIAGTLLPQEQSVLAVRATSNPEAYDHFLRGNFLLASRSPAGVARAIAEYGAALREDSAFSQAEARIALGYGLYAAWGWDYPGVPSDSQVTLGVQAADRALALDSSSSDGWMARGLLLHLRHPRTLEGTLPALKRATELDPRNAETWQQYGAAMMFVGRFEESTVSYRRALALEPGRGVTWNELSLANQLLHRDAVAVAASDSAVLADPTFYPAYAWRSRVRLHRGDRSGALADAEMALRMSPPGEEYYGLAPLAAVAAADGDSTKARRLMAQALAPFAKRPFGPIPASAVIFGLVAAGQKPFALDWLERVTPRGAMLWWAMQFSEMDALRDDPRFKRVMDESRPPGAQ